jgi:hypothetical protein
MLSVKRRANYGTATGNVLQPHVMSAFVGPYTFLCTLLLRTVMNREDGSIMLLRNFGTYLLTGSNLLTGCLTLLEDK